MSRRSLTLVAFGLGVLMIVFGVATMFTSTPRPEIATTGVTLILATGLIGVNGNNKRGRKR